MERWANAKANRNRLRSRYAFRHQPVIRILSLSQSANLCNARHNSNGKIYNHRIVHAGRICFALNRWMLVFFGHACDRWRFRTHANATERETSDGLSFHYSRAPKIQHPTPKWHISSLKNGRSVLGPKANMRTNCWTLRFAHFFFRMNFHNLTQAAVLCTTDFTRTQLSR